MPPPTFNQGRSMPMEPDPKNPNAPLGRQMLPDLPFRPPEPAPPAGLQQQRKKQFNGMADGIQDLRPEMQAEPARTRTIGDVVRPAAERIRGLMGQLNDAYDRTLHNKIFTMDDAQLQANFGHRPMQAPPERGWPTKNDLFSKQNQARGGLNPEEPRIIEGDPLFSPLIDEPPAILHYEGYGPGKNRFY